MVFLDPLCAIEGKLGNMKQPLKGLLEVKIRMGLMDNKDYVVLRTLYVARSIHLQQIQCAGSSACE